MKPSSTTSASRPKLPVMIPQQLALDFFQRGVPLDECDSDILLHKSNAIINVKGTPLSLLGQKIVNACYFIAKPNIMTTEFHKCRYSYFCWLVGFNSKNVEYLKQEMVEVQERPIQINIVDPNRPDRDLWHSASYLTEIAIANGEICFRVPVIMRKEIANPERYSPLNLQVHARFTTNSSYLLYQYCKEMFFRGETPVLPLGVWRQKLGVEGKATYEDFKFFKSKILKPAQDAVMKHTDLNLEMIVTKTGRQITHLQFRVTKKAEADAPKCHETWITEELFVMFKQEFGMSEADITVLSKYEKGYAREKIEYTRHMMRQHKKRKTPIGRPWAYLLKALENDYRFSDEVLKQMRDEEAKENHVRQSATFTSQAKKQASLADDVRVTEFLSLPKETQAAVLQAMVADTRFKSLPAKTKQSLELGTFQASDKWMLGALRQYLETSGSSPTLN